MTGDSLPVIDPESLSGDRRDVTVHGLVLAAGSSTRFGEENKLLAPIDGSPLVHHATETIVESGVETVTVVLGHDANSVKEALDGLSVDFVVNESADAGQSTSVMTGIDVVANRNPDAVLIALGDMPNVSVETVELLIDAYERGAGNALAAAVDGTRGNPVLFDSRYFPDLQDLSGDIGARDILQSANDGALVETGDPGVVVDIDRPTDLPTDE